MPQNASAVLKEALGRSGASALPYAQEFKFLVQQHLIDLVTDMPSLRISTQEYVHIDGRAVELLLAEGTLPMYYQGHKYNIPVAIWLPEQYPLAAPMAYVVPTPDMVIKPQHSFVDPSGLVHTAYIAQWQYPSSNLRVMAQDMSMHFGGDPPLFLKPKNWKPGSSGNMAATAQPTARPPMANSFSSEGSLGFNDAMDNLHVHNPLAQSNPSFGSLGGVSFTSAGSTGAQPVGSSAGQPTSQASAGAVGGGFDSVWAAMMAASASLDQQPQASQQQQQPPASQPPPMKENPSAKLAEALRTAMITLLNKRLHVSLTAVAQGAAAQAKEGLQLQASLKQRGEQLESEVAVLQAERVALDRLSQELAASNAQLERWLAENEHLAKAAEDPTQLDVDTVITATDPLSQQALEVQAQDLALEDALYALDKALNQGIVEADAYLKQVRTVCRRQLFVRVCGNKVAAAQGKAPRSGERLSQPYPNVQRTLSAGRPVVLPQGDSWSSGGIFANSREASGGAPWHPAS